jgi:phospholipid transport system substrate-binding protein
MITRRGLGLAGLGLLGAVGLSPSEMARAQSASAAAQPIAALNAGIIEVMQAGRAAPFASRMATLTPVVLKAYDLPLILQNSIGPSRWATISDPEKAELLDVFTQFTVASYVANFDAFGGEKFVIAPETRAVGHDTVVQTKILGTAGETTRLDYVMRETGGAWHVVDVLLDGSISRVAVTRSDFRALLGQGDARPLIASLRGKVAKLSSGAAS